MFFNLDFCSYLPEEQLLFSVKYLAIESNRQKHFLIAKRAAKTVKTMLFEFLDDVITLRRSLDIYKYRWANGDCKPLLPLLLLELILNVLLFKNILYHENVVAKLC